MASTTCPDDRTLLPAALGEGMDAAARSHLDGCSGCRDRVERLRAEVHALRDSPSPASYLGPSGFTESGSTDGEDFEPPGPTPAVIGKYPVVGRLGAGGQGEVFRAVHPELGLDLVIKLGRKPLGRGGLGRDRLVAEGRLLADLDHPNLVRVLDLGEHDGRPFLAMELVRGCTLGQHSRQCHPEPRRAAALVAELARAVAYLHARGVVHQDLTPANILVDEAGRTRLIDFGLASLRDAWAGDGDRDGPSGGTLAYMAPEQARGESARVGPRSDVFALGAVLYSLLTGHPPFEGRGRAEVWERARLGEFDRGALRRPDIPRRLGRTVLRAMAPVPGARHPSAEALADELERATRRPRRAAALALAGAVLLGSSGSAVGWALWPRGLGRANPGSPPTAPSKGTIDPTDNEAAALRVDEFKPGVPGGADPVRPPLPSRGTIDLAIYEAAEPGEDEFKPGDPGRQGLHLRDGRALPLGPRDWVRIEAKVDRPAYLYVVWVDADGKANPLWPWRNADWADRPEVETPRDSLMLPELEGDRGVDIAPLTGGPAGVEALLLLIRATPLGPSENEAVKQILTRPRPRRPATGDRAATAIWLEDGERVVDEPTRAPNLARPGSSGDPVIQIGNVLKELREIFPRTRGVCFGNRGDH